MRTLSAIVIATLSGLALSICTGAAAGFMPAPPATGAVLTLEQVRQIALREAKFNADPHPTETIIAKGRLVVALRVMESEKALALPRPSTGPEAPGDARSLVYLVAMRGHFVGNFPIPYGHQAPRGKVLELVIDAHTGFVEDLLLGRKVPVPLSRLGPVTRYRPKP